MKFIKDNVTINPDTNCWEWNKSVTSAGYGQFTRNGKYWTTHRYVYTQIYGDIPKNAVIRHLCHNTKCCNPEHLKVGSHQDNWYDSKDIHLKADRKRAKGYIIQGTKYHTLKEAANATSITQNSLIKFTDKITRIFDVDAYRHGCSITGCNPKI